MSEKLKVLAERLPETEAMQLRMSVNNSGHVKEWTLVVGPVLDSNAEHVATFYSRAAFEFFDEALKRVRGGV